jgi:hypothetical protein
MWEGDVTERVVSEIVVFGWPSQLNVALCSHSLPLAFLSWVTLTEPSLCECGQGLAAFNIL